MAWWTAQRRDGAEIDIIESFSTANQYGVTVHWDGYGADHQQSSTNVSAPGLHDATWYHTVTLDWTSARMTFSVLLRGALGFTPWRNRIR
ncbi:hypothetical protein ACFVY1_41070 [Streptomyces sp. NPDC058293]|uniref:hypothetical protein n=1 Tax=Streptomyces sp. NPDC058293 TaxID=3346429 RepID=UPI0036EC6862